MPPLKAAGPCRPAATDGGDSSDANTSLDDLVNDINDALADEGIDDRVTAMRVGDRIALSTVAIGEDAALTVTADEFDPAVLEMFQETSYYPRAFVRLGLPDAFIPHGTQSALRKLNGIDADGIERAVVELMQSRPGHVLRAIGQAAC